MTDATDRRGITEDTLLGVVLPDPDPPWRDDEEALEAQTLESRRNVEPAREYEVVTAVVTRGLAGVRQRIALLRTEREHINDEIRRLVAEERQLQRMSRIVETPDTAKRRTRLAE